MKNLAGVKDADKYIKEELHLAGIEAIHVGGTVCSEVPYSIIGRIKYWTLTRAWYYWIASVERTEDGLPLEDAVKLHETPHPTEEGHKLGDSIRSGGHCGCPSPAEHGAEVAYNDEFINQLKEIGEYMELDFRGVKYPDITVGRISELCNEGKLTVKRYVTSYHIDDQIGLNEFAKAINNLQ